MTESGFAAQVVKVTENHTFELDEHVLEEVLMMEEIRDLPVAVVSVAGAYRSGKSFLLNFFIKYLTSSPDARQDGSWMGDEDESLTGFKWRTGIKRTTMGILLWSEPITVTLPSGDKVAVLLVDTQGTFDSRSTVRDCSTIFALSTLLSSVQIYNISVNIQEDDLQHLQLFTEYGKMVKDQGTKAFQVLQFLVRDWQFPFDYAYGAVGGEQFIQEKLKVTPDLPKDMIELRQQIRSSFEQVSCFLMPHPGFKVLEAGFKGSIADLGPDFKIYLTELVKSLFKPENLKPKMINGELVRARDLFQYFKIYMALFNSDTIPNPTTIMKATVEAGLLSALNESREIYETGMDSECGPKQPSVPAGDLLELHRKYLAKAQTSFIAKKKMGSQEEATKYLQMLSTDLEKRLPQFVQSNLAKIQIAINKAKDSYEEAILNISKNQLLCVHPLDLEKVHKAGYNAAISTFDASRKRISNKNDDERTKFLQNFEKRYELLRLSNDQNNKMIVSMLRMQYWQDMQEKTGLENPLSDNQFKREHESAQRKALENFDLKRNIPSQYTEDVYRYNLVTEINQSFIQLKAMNKSKNKIAMQAAVDVYNNYMKTTWDVTSQCLHPKEVEREHQSGLCHALLAFRPNKVCSDGWNYGDEDEVTLMEILRQRYSEFKILNDSANKTAEQQAFNVYVTTMEDLCRPSLTWLLIYPLIQNLTTRSTFHENSKTKAIEFFNGKRQGGGYYSTDPYKDNLEQMMEAYYSKNYAIGQLMETAIKFVAQSVQQQ